MLNTAARWVFEKHKTAWLSSRMSEKLSAMIWIRILPFIVLSMAAVLLFLADVVVKWLIRA